MSMQQETHNQADRLPKVSPEPRTINPGRLFQAACFVLVITGLVSLLAGYLSWLAGLIITPLATAKLVSVLVASALGLLSWPLVIWLLLRYPKNSDHLITMVSSLPARRYLTILVISLMAYLSGVAVIQFIPISNPLLFALRVVLLAGLAAAVIFLTTKVCRLSESEMAKLAGRESKAAQVALHSFLVIALALVLWPPSDGAQLAWALSQSTTPANTDSSIASDQAAGSATDTDGNTSLNPDSADPAVPSLANTLTDLGNSIVTDAQRLATLDEPVVTAPLATPAGAVSEVSRDAYSTTWQMTDGSFTTRVLTIPQMYTDSPGDERDIDNNLVTQAAPAARMMGATPAPTVYVNAANSFTTYLPAAGSAFSILKDGFRLTVTPNFGALGSSRVQANAIRYNEVAAGLDLQYTVLGNALEEELILSHPLDSYDFSYTLSAAGITFIERDGQIFGFKTDDLDATGQPTAAAIAEFIISAPAMTDNAGASSNAVHLELATAVDGSANLTIQAEANWLADPARAYPVTIDPTYMLTASELSYGTIQAFAGYSSGPDMVHNQLSYLYAGLEDGSLVGVPPIVYGQCWSYIRINDIQSYIAAHFSDLPSVAILSATLSAWRYSGVLGSRTVMAEMIQQPWAGNGLATWNNRPQQMMWLDGQDVGLAGSYWVNFDITEAFKLWRTDPASNYGIMLVPADESQPAVAFSGPNNPSGGHQLYLDLSWTVPNPVDENMPLDTPIVNIRALTYRNVAWGLQQVTGVFGDGLIRPTLAVDYTLATDST
ncbi:MAG: DNRLRE domain-containing protein, partial [Actinomycetia bacterium]|nr:DNRLRE domain-containing protein [Actinomycetes bacterium]